MINDIHLGSDGKVEFVCASDAYRDCLTCFHEADAVTFEAGGSALMGVEKYDLAFDRQET